MKFLKAIFTIIGALVVAGMIVLGVKYGGMLKQFDSGALGAYMSMAEKVLETGDPAKGMIIKKKMVIPEGMTKEEAIANAIEIMDEVAEQNGLAVVDNKVMNREPYIQIRSYCSKTIGQKFIAHSPEFIGFMPCRIGIVELPNGDFYIYTMALDLMINGGKKLSDDMLKLANEVRTAMYGMLEKGAAGEEL